MGKMNIAYASTRGWNIGDDFIRLGCEIVMDMVFSGHNCILYDKSEHVRCGNGVPWEKGEFHGNSLELFKHKDLKIDLCLVAGTPANSGAVTENFLKIDAPLIGIALGEDPSMFSKRAVELWRRADLITTRCEDYLDGYRRLFGEKVVYLPCTSLLYGYAARLQREDVKALRTVALGWKCRQRDTVSYNGMPDHRYDQMIGLYRELINARRDVEFYIVCHHIDELADAQRCFPDLDVRYSYSEYDAVFLYCNCDYVVTPRVHGVGCCASLSRGGTLLPTDGRSGTVKGFLAGCTWDKDEILKRMDGCVEQSSLLKAHIDDTHQRYLDLLFRYKEAYDKGIGGSFNGR